MRLLPAVAASLFLAASTGCSPQWPVTSDLINQASRGLGQTRGFEVKGVYTQGRNEITLDLIVNHRQPSERGTLTVNGMPVEIMVVEGKTYLKGARLASTLIDATTPFGAQTLKALKSSWYTTSDPLPVDPGPLFDPSLVHDAFLVPASDNRTDGLSLGSQTVVKLWGRGVTAYIEQGASHQLLHLTISQGAFGISRGDFDFTNYDRAAPIDPPSPALEIDQPAAMPPYYVITSFDTSKCLGNTCPLSATVMNEGSNIHPPSSPSTVTMEVVNAQTGEVIESCQAPITPDVPHQQETSVTCSLNHGFDSWSFTYRFTAVPDNPAYD